MGGVLSTRNSLATGSWTLGAALASAQTNIPVFRGRHMLP
jgi:hypothetical protein